jgi:hypothetical protein
MWEFLDDSGITIQDQVGGLNLCQEGDCFITQLLYENGAQGKALWKLNLCQLFLQVEMLWEK